MKLKMKLKKKRHRISTPKKMVQRLPIALAQAEAGHTSQNLLNEIPQLIYSYILSKINY